jgi:hypothetical protein
MSLQQRTAVTYYFKQFLFAWRQAFGLSRGDLMSMSEAALDFVAPRKSDSSGAEEGEIEQLRAQFSAFAARERKSQSSSY